MVAYLSKSDASTCFNQVVDFLNSYVIQYALMVNPTIYVSCIKQFWATVSIKKANDVVKLRALIDGKRVCVSAKRTAWNEFSCSMVFTVICLATVIINDQVDELSSPNNQYTSLALTQKVFANMRRIGKGFSRVETPLFATIHVLHCPKKVAQLEQDKIAQALEIFKLKKRVKKLEKKKRSSSSGLKRLRKVLRRMHPNRGKIEAIDADKDITLVDAETQVNMDAEFQGRIDDDNAATKDVNADEPTVFDDEEVTMTKAQTLIKMKAKKARLLNEKMAKRLHDEEVEQAAAREKQEKDDLEKAKVLQQHLKRKPISIAQARKNMIIYLKNMAGYNMKYFRGITYENVRPIFEREYNKVQTLFKPDKDVEEPQKKRVAEETLLQESSKKLKVVKVSVSEFKVEALQVKYPLIDWEIYSEGSRSYWKIIRVGGITEAYQSFEDMLKGFDREDLDALWRLVKEKFSSAVPTVDKEKALWVELTRLFKPNADDVFWKLQIYIHDPLTWKLYTNYRVHHVSLTRKHEIFMLTEKDYPLSNVVMIMMLSARLQVKEDSEMAKDLVMTIFMEANKPKSRSLDTSSK
nr:hypothetical protein [Tanacetum cinerariifolium]